MTTTTPTVEITNLNQIVEFAKTAADVATDNMDTYLKMKNLRTAALFLLTEKLERLEMTEDQEALLEAFRFVYKEDEMTDEDIDQAEKNLFGPLAAFQETTGNKLIFNLLFWTHFILEVQEQAWKVIKAAKDDETEGAHKEFALFRIESNFVVAQLDVFQDRLLA
jgi:hypothetical protein